MTSSDHPSFKNNEKKDGFTNGYSAFVRKNSEHKLNTGKHEVGHNFGMSHTNGNMHSEDNNDDISTTSIAETLSRVGLGTVKYGSLDGGSAKATIKEIIGKAPSNFNSGSVITRQKFDRNMNKALKKG